MRSACVLWDCPTQNTSTRSRVLKTLYLVRSRLDTIEIMLMFSVSRGEIETRRAARDF